MLLSQGIQMPDGVLTKTVLPFAELGGHSYPGLMHSKPTSKVNTQVKYEQSLERTDTLVIMLHNYNREGSIEYVRRLVHFLAKHGKVVVTIAPFAGAAQQLLQESGASHALVWPESSDTGHVTVNSLMEFTINALGITPNILFFNTVLWTRAINTNEPYAYGNPRVVWILHEWSITRYTAEPSGDPSDSKHHWYGENFPELHETNLRRLALQTDALVFVARAQQQLWQDFTYMTHVIPGTFTLPSYHMEESCEAFTRDALHIKSTTFVLTVLGTICPRKRQNWAIHALKALQARGFDVLLLIIGSMDNVRVKRSLIRGTSSSEFVAELVGATRNSRVRFIPETSCVSAIFQLADLHLSPSHTEVFPLNVLDAMHSHVPVVATCAGGTSEQFTHPETRWMLVDNRDNTSELFVATVLKAVEMDRQDLRALGKLQADVPQELAKNFDDKWGRLLETIRERSMEIQKCRMFD